MNPDYGFKGIPTYNRCDLKKRGKQSMLMDKLDIIVLAGQSNVQGRGEIGKAYVLRAGGVETAGLLSNKQKVGNGDNIHFCREALRILGERYFAQYAMLTRT